jgi:hypothetical protein
MLRHVVGKGDLSASRGRNRLSAWFDVLYSIRLKRKVLWILLEISSQDVAVGCIPDVSVSFQLWDLKAIGASCDLSRRRRQGSYA